MQNSDDSQNLEEWTKVQSKRYPNKFYYFNKKTGKSKWADSEDDAQLEDNPQKDVSQRIKCVQKTNRRIVKGISKTPANDRLKVLQKTLQKSGEKKVESSMRLGMNQVIAEAKSQSNILTKNNNITEKKIAKISKTSVQDRLKIKTTSAETGDDIVMNEQNFPDPSSASSDPEAVELMDWEPIPEEIVLYEISTLRQKGTTQKGTSPVTSTEVITLQSLNTIGNNFYIVLDTNIFISNLKFLESLSTLIFPQLKHSFLVVPYVVLQELDNLKHRRNDRISTIAKHAIKFLNHSFTATTSRLCGQSAIKSSEYLIEIQNSDDKIINCCLQISTNSNWVILLSNDINLRNKALFNQIRAYSKADLENNKISLAAEFNKLN